MLPKQSERLEFRLTANSRFPQMVRPLRVLKLSFQRAFDDDAFAVAKAAAYSSILTFFPALLVLGAVLASSDRFEFYVDEISDALGSILPAGSSTAIQYVRSKASHPAGFLITTSLLTLWTASSAIVSWMEGFRKAYRLRQTWGLVRERLVACSLVFLAGLPLTFATILIAFGSQIENHLVPYVSHAWSPLIILMWTGIRWSIAA